MSRCPNRHPVPRLDAGPVVELVERRRQDLDEMGVPSRSWSWLAAAAGVSTQTLLRARQRGLTPAVADAVAVALGFHPLELWGDSWCEVLEVRWRGDGAAASGTVG